MNAKTKEAIIQHGSTLLKAFPESIEKDPIALCKKLRRIENSISIPIIASCNGELDDVALDQAIKKAEKKVCKLLGISVSQNGKPGHVASYYGFFINRDPRGRALKLGEEWTRAFNEKQLAAKLPILLTDMGGNGLLSPDLNT